MKKKKKYGNVLQVVIYSFFLFPWVETGDHLLKLNVCSLRTYSERSTTELFLKKVKKIAQTV